MDREDFYNLRHRLQTLHHLPTIELDTPQHALRKLLLEMRNHDERLRRQQLVIQERLRSMDRLRVHPRKGLIEDE